MDNAIRACVLQAYANHPDLQPRLVAYTAFGMLETFGATLHLHQAGGFSLDQSHDTMASHVFAVLTGYMAR
jgi:hypothetical protein